MTGADKPSLRLLRVGRPGLVKNHLSSARFGIFRSERSRLTDYDRLIY